MGGGTVFPFCALSCAAVAKELFAVFITFYFACSFVIEENRRFCRTLPFPLQKHGKATNKDDELEKVTSILLLFCCTRQTRGLLYRADPR